MSTSNGLKTFFGGVHPPDEKELSANKPFEIMPAPGEVLIHLSQHIGKPSKVLVKKRDQVVKGQVLAAPDGFVSSVIKSPISGKVKDISMMPNPSGYPKEAITIISEDNDQIELMEPMNPDSATPDEIIERVKQAGIVGQGGAAFPTFIKLMPPPDKKIEYLIINAVECEPYLTRDYRYMLEMPNELIGGLKLLMKALKVEKGIIGIESNKPKAIEIIKAAAANEKNIQVDVFETKYPQGAEKMLIKASTGREVPPGKLPMDVGCVIQNVRTAIAVYDAVIKGESQITAALTVTGRGIKETKNLIVPIGTKLGEIIEFCGGLNENAEKVVVGGPMMGVAQYDIDTPITKATSGILVLTKEEINHQDITSCVRCGKCIEVCPINLLPTSLARLSQLNRLDDAEDLGITNCMECGSCEWTCPANLPLVQWLRLGKQRVIRNQRNKKTA